MLEAARADYLRAPGPPAGAPLRALRTFAYSYGLQALIVYRLGRWLSAAKRFTAPWGLALPLWLGYHLLAALMRRAYGIRLELSADIGPGLTIHHFGEIRLRDCRLGRNCVIHHEVLIEPSLDGRGGPWLGDRVWVGPHARIVGCLRIGNGATVGAGAVVTQDVQANCLVLGNPARVTRYGYDNGLLP